MEKTKKKINFNYLKILLCTVLGIIAGIICGFKVNMLKVHATAFSNSTITYNENQTLYTYYTKYYQTFNEYMSIWTTDTDFYVNISRLTVNGIYTNDNYTNCRLSNNVITCTAYYFITPLSTGNISRSNGTYTFTVNSDTVSFSDNTYSILTTGYTEQQYQAYGQQQYNAGYSAGVAYVQAHPAEYNLYTTAQYNANYTAGQNAVLNSPNTYNLYTQAQYNANYTSGYNAGISYVQNHLSEYNLYTSAQYTAYGSSQYTAGQNAVLNSPNTYNLYTSAQYNSYGTNQFSAGESAVQNDPHTYGLYTSTDMTNNYNAGVQYVLDHPSEYNLYTTAQYNAHAQEQYSAGYSAGLIDNTGSYNAGIQYVVNHPSEYNLYTPEEYTAYGNTRYNAGIQYVIDHPSEYNLYTTQEYNSYYQEGYNAGIEQGEENVITHPENYNLYTEDQYLNNGSYSDFILNLVDTVWINQPVLSNGTYIANWTKINNNLLSIDNGTIRLDNVYTTYNNIKSIRIFYKSYLTNDLPMYFKNIIDPSIYEDVEVGLRCYVNLPSTTINDNYNNMCQVLPGLTANVNGVSLEYEYLINDVNYFDSLYGSETEQLYMNYMKYNCLEINKVVYSNTVAYLNSEINYINYDLSSINLTSYNMGYDKGYNAGQNVTQQAKYNEGYNDGYDTASELYTNLGGDGNTLVGLAGTILFSPVQMMKQIFNFEILGVNLAGFILSIITLLIVIWLVKRLI